MTTQTNTYGEYRDSNPITETDAQGRYARIERDVEGGGMPTFVVLLGTEYAGTILDEADADGNHLPRGRYSAHSARTGAAGFFESVEKAADAIAETWPAPKGPKGEAAPRGEAARMSLRITDAMERYNTIAEAAALYAAGGIRPASAWKRAAENEWQRRIAAVRVRDEDEYENCMSVLGGEVHTATPERDPKMYTMPLCRTGSQNHMRTRYTITKLEITCSNCIEQRERRAVRRAAQQG